MRLSPTDVRRSLLLTLLMRSFRSPLRYCVAARYVPASDHALLFRELLDFRLPGAQPRLMLGESVWKKNANGSYGISTASFEAKDRRAVDNGLGGVAYDIEGTTAMVFKTHTKVTGVAARNSAQGSATQIGSFGSSVNIIHVDGDSPAR